MFVDIQDVIAVLPAYGEWLMQPLRLFSAGDARIYWQYLAGAFVMALALYVLVHKLSPKAALEKIFPKAIYTHPSAILDYQFFYVNFLLEAALIVPLAAGLSQWVSDSIQQAVVLENLLPGLNQSYRWLDWAYTLLIFIVLDLGLFIAHYLSHKIPWLWEFHKVHHSAEVLTPMTVYRMHPVDDLLNFAITGLMVGAVDGLVQASFHGSVGMIGIYGVNILYFGFYLFGYNLRHSHVWLDYGPVLSRVLVSPAQHQIHHSQAAEHIDKNFGFVFAWWDAAAKSLHIPKPGEENVQFGLAGEQSQPFPDLWRVYALPFAQVFQRGFRTRFGVAAFIGLVLLAGLWIFAGQYSSKDSVYLEDLTWTEVRDQIHTGTTTVIIPTGGTEQNGPHMILGKHNRIIHYTSGEIAKRLGKTLVAPVIAYVPEGNISPPTDHMRYAGTISLLDTHFEALLEDTARSLKVHGFKLICLMGDSGWNQSPQARVAKRLSAEWAGQGVRVLHVGEYYNLAPQYHRMMEEGLTMPEIGNHAGVRDTSELMALEPSGVRSAFRQASYGSESDLTGVDGNPLKASAALGHDLLKIKMNGAVARIRRAQKTR